MNKFLFKYLCTMAKYPLRLSEAGGWTMLRIMLRQKTRAITRKPCLFMLFLVRYANMKLSARVALVPDLRSEAK
jgi:hypothetical protein